MPGQAALRDSDIIIHSGGRTPRDRITGGVCVTDSNHSQVHAGKAYHISKSLSLGAGLVDTLTVDCPAGVYVHFQGFTAVLGEIFLIEMFEGDTPTTGTATIPVQRNRYDNYSSALTVHNTAVAANITQMIDMTYPATRQGGTGFVQDGIEWVLSPGKSYTFKVTNTSAQATVGFVKLDWYEEGAA